LADPLLARVSAVRDPYAEPSPLALLRWLGPIADFGVRPDTPATEAKHQRFCNLASFAGGLCALLFLGLSLPIITDWGQTTPVEWGVIAANSLGALLLLVPLALARVGNHAAARVVLLTVSIAHVAALQVFFAAAAPVHLFMVTVALMTMAAFPERERGRMAGFLACSVVVFVALLWLRARNQPVIEVTRPGVRLTMEVTIATGALVFAVVVTGVLRTTTRRAELHALREHDRADRLLLNILPGQIAARLKADPSTIADGFREVTVLFADLVGFTPMTRTMTPMQTLEMVNEVFSRFDALVDRFGLEKIKTIGDAYMLAGGLPTPIATHAKDVAHMALAMRDELARIPGPGGAALKLRIGIATGPVVAGVIGRKKFLYDLWGDTVNTASRMESSGEVGRIQVNAAAWARLKGEFRFEPRGLVEIKGQGQVETWFLEGPAEAAPVAGTTAAGA
jgi:guanylate cyclase